MVSVKNSFIQQNKIQVSSASKNDGKLFPVIYFLPAKPFRNFAVLRILPLQRFSISHFEISEIEARGNRASAEGIGISFRHFGGKPGSGRHHKLRYFSVLKIRLVGFPEESKYFRSIAL